MCQTERGNVHFDRQQACSPSPVHLKAPQCAVRIFKWGTVKYLKHAKRGPLTDVQVLGFSEVSLSDSVKGQRSVGTSVLLPLSFPSGWSASRPLPPRLRPRDAWWNAERAQAAAQTPQNPLYKFCTYQTLFVHNSTNALCSPSPLMRHNIEEAIDCREEVIQSVMSGQVLLFFPCLICNMTMCVPERKDYARKCSEAVRLKDPLQCKCSPSQCKSGTRGLYVIFPYFVSVRLTDFLPCCPLNSISSRSINQNVLQWDPN